MRVSIIGSRGYPSTYGGYETLVRRLAPYLVERGHQVTVYSRSDMMPDTNPGHPGVKVVNSWGTSGRASSTLTHGFTSSLHTAGRRPDCALVLNVANGFFLPLLRAAKVPSLLNVDGVEWQRDKWSRTGKAVFRLGASFTKAWSDALVADSNAIAEMWRDQFGRDSFYIPYGADIVDPDRNLLPSLDLQPDRYNLIVARLVPENNVALLLDAANAYSSLPTVVVGSSGAGVLPEGLAERLGGPNVKWLGHVRDQDLLAQLWGGAALYLHGHSVGGTNPALVQAMGFGAPILALDTPFNREVLGSEDQLFKGCVESLGEVLGLRELDADWRSKAREHEREQVRDRFLWSRICDDYESALLGLTSGTA